MVMNESAIFTAIPGGRVPGTGHLRVTVFVTPRLTPNAAAPPEGVELAAFRAFSNWPGTVRDARFTFEISGHGQVEGFPLDNALAPDPELWKALFGQTRVGAAGFQHFEDAVVHSYPVEEVSKAVTGLYQTVAVASPTGFPPITRGPLDEAVQNLGSPIRPDPRRNQSPPRLALVAYLQSLRKLSDPPKGRFLDVASIPADAVAKVSLAAATAFYDRQADPWSADAVTAGAPEPVAPEFHSFVARCADFPELLRRLGLAFDLFIKDDPGIGEVSTIRLLAGSNEGLLESLLAPDQARPATLARHTARVWVPTAREERPDVVDGSLAIDRSSDFTLEQLDPDGSALKVSNLLATLQRTTAELQRSAQANGNAPSMTADASSLPALKSAGLIVARRNRAAGLVAQFDRAAGHEADRAGKKPALLGVTDVTRGWRMDIQDRSAGSGQWLSLHRREGDYALVTPDGEPRPLAVQPMPDEAYLKAASTSSNAPQPAADQYLHETLVGWDGWSLAAKRPGLVLADNAVVEADAVPQVARTGFPLAATFRPLAGSLPRLRFGRHYRIRVRAVDLTGWSIPDDQLDRGHERDFPESYQRWEPVPSPAVIPLTQFTEGESLMRLVIRSTVGASVHDYVAQQRVRTLPGHEPVGRLGIVYREENERHLAAPIASVQLVEMHGMLDAALTGDPAATAAQFAVAAKEAGSYLTLPGGRLVTRSGPARELSGSKDEALTDGDYVVHDRPDLPLPYLPDPLARGVSLTTLPGDTATRLQRWPGDPALWHDRQPIRLRIVEGAGPPVFDAASRTLIVSLPQATLATVRLSCFLDDDDPQLMRVWHLIEQDQNPASAEQLKTVLQGRHWMLTPYTELTLVHAVERPLEKPSIVLAAQQRRSSAETFAWLPGTVHNHAASTGRIDIDGAWTDPVDDVLEPGPRVEHKQAHIADFQLEATESDALIGRTAGPAGGPLGPRHQVRHEFGDTRHRYVDYTPTATTRFREYFPPQITTVPALVTTVGDPLSVDIFSSARPAAPEIRYLVPTWEWKTETLSAGSAFGMRRVRTGGGLRVYLGRPWFSSGPDELLGVVVRIQPWITWPTDISAGIAGSIEAQAHADAWARVVLEHANARVSRRTPLARQVVKALAPMSSPRVAAPRTRARTADERFLVKAQSTVTQARTADLKRAGKLPQSAISAAKLEQYLPLYAQTGAAGRQFTSVWAADPVFAAAAVASGPYIHQFPLRTAVGNALDLAEVTGEKVTVIGHTPQYDPVRRLWYCDLQLDAGDSYTPMVQLALARYQPHSVAGTELSSVVKADFVQLLPQRESTFIETRDGAAMLVTLAGPVGIPEHAVALPNVASRVNASRLVQAWVERLPGDATTDLGWVAVGATVSLQVQVTRTRTKGERYSNIEWAGAVAMPERALGERYRVRLAEYELHRADTLGSTAIARFRTREHRIVYSDTVEVPAPQ